MSRFPSVVRQEVSRRINVPHEERRVIFHHLPKTAGSTFRRIVEHQFDPSEVSHSEITKEVIAELDTPEGRQKRFFAGHFQMKLLRQHFRNDIWLLFLRDPVDRIISQYFNLHEPKRYQPQWVERFEKFSEAEEFARYCQSISLEEFITSDHPRATLILDNYHTRHLSKIGGGRIEDDAQRQAFLDEAMQNLPKFDFIGLQECFDLSLQLFGVTFGVRPFSRSNSYTANLNHALSKDKYAELLSPEAMRALKERNWADYALLKSARRIFHERLLDATFPALEDHYENTRVATIDATPPLLGWKEFDVASLDRRGFHRIETDGDGQSFAWTGFESPAVLELPLQYPARGLRFSMRVLAEKEAGFADQIKVEAAGAKVVALDIAKGESDWIVSGRIVQDEPSRKWPVSLKLLTPSSAEPDDGEKVGRKLGVALHSIRVARG